MCCAGTPTAYGKPQARLDLDRIHQAQARRRVPRGQPGRRRRAARHGRIRDEPPPGRPRARGARAARRTSTARSDEQYDKFAQLRERASAVRAARPVRARDAGEPIPLGRGRAGVGDLPAVLVRRDLARIDLAAKRTRRWRWASTWSADAANTGEGGEDPYRYRTKGTQRDRTARSSRSRPDGSVSRRSTHRGPTSCRSRWRRARKPGEGGQLAGTQGVGGDRAPAAHAAGRVADLSAAAPRHLLDRGPRAAHLRPQAGEPARGRLGEARRHDRRRDDRRRRRQRVSPRSSCSPAPTAAPVRRRCRRSRTPGSRGRSVWPRRSRRSSPKACVRAYVCASTAGSAPDVT